MPKHTPEEREARQFLLKLISDVAAAKRAVGRYYPDGLTPFDENALHTAFEERDRLEVRVNALLSALKTADTEGDKTEKARLKADLVAVRAGKRKAEAAVSALSKAYLRYRRAAGPFTDAGRVMSRAAFYALPEFSGAAVPDPKP